METILSTQLSIPLSQILTVLSLTTFVLVFGYPRLALFLNYCFLIYCSYMSNAVIFTEKGTINLDGVTFPYIAFGFAVILLATMGLVHNNE
jgi:hypothetical protein